MPVRGGDRDPGQRARAAAPGAADRQPGAGDRGAVRSGPGGVAGDPLGHLVRAEQGHLHIEAAGRLGRRVLPGRDAADAVRQRLVQPVAQHPELERVEQLVDLLALPHLRDQLIRARADVGQRDVADQRGHLPVAQHVAEVLAQRITRPALHLVDPVDEVFQRAELPDPLGRGLLPHPGDAGQVVARVTADGGKVGVLLGRQAVLLLHRLRGEAGHLGDAPPGHQHRHVGVDELEHVPVAGDDQHVHAVVFGPGGQRGDHVVGLEPGHGQPGDAERVQHLEDQAQLAAEVLGGLPPVRLVLDVLLVPEGGLAAVEGHRDVGRLLVPQHVDEHGREPVHGVGRLACGGREVFGRQREEGPVGQRVPVQQEQPPRSRAGARGLGPGLGILAARGGRILRRHGSNPMVKVMRPGGICRQAAPSSGRPRQELNAKTVAEVNVLPGLRVVLGKFGWLGRSG